MKPLPPEIAKLEDDIKGYLAEIEELKEPVKISSLLGPALRFSIGIGLKT